MNEKEFRKKLIDSVNEYYHLEDRFEEVASKLQLVDDVCDDEFHFRKKPFILITVALSLLVILLTSIISCCVSYHSGLDKNAAAILYQNSLREAKPFLDSNLDKYNNTPMYSITSNDNYLFNLYSGKNGSTELYVYQLYFKNDAKYKIELSNYTQAIVLNYNTGTEEDDSPKLGILNYSNFVINDNDIMYGKIYIDNELVKNFTINF